MTVPLWNSGEIEQATGGAAKDWFEVGGSLSIDTRTLQPGDLFVALQAERDGHDFVGKALEAGAAGSLVSRPVDGPHVLVEDSLRALEALALAARMRSGAVRCAVTGSVGKTSFKEMLARIFRAHGTAHWPEKSFNNHWGVPLTLARMPEDTARAVFEIGMSTPGEIAPRSRLVRPHIAVVTHVTGAHLEGLGSLDAVAEEKSAIFTGLEAAGTAILPDENPFADLLEARARGYQPTATVERFGTAAGLAGRITDYAPDGQGCRVALEIRGEAARVRLDAAGRHFADLAAAALLAATRTGMSAAEAAAALEGYSPPEGRGTVRTLHFAGGGTALLVNDAYNANPASMRAALSALAARPAQRRLAALGDMLELGAGEEEAHRALAGPVREAGVAMAWLSGPRMVALRAALEGEGGVATGEADLDAVAAELRPGDVLLVKGSNASGMGRLAAGLAERLAPPQNHADEGKRG